MLSAHNAQIKAQLDWSLDSPDNWQYRSHWDRGVNAHDGDASNLPGEFTTINLNNMFAPRAVTSAQQAQGYAQATREAALLIAVRMVQNLK